MKSILFSDYKWFDSTPAGFNTLSPLTILVGANHSGKTRILQALSGVSTSTDSGFLGAIHLSAELTDDSISPLERAIGHALYDDAAALVGATVRWTHRNLSDTLDGQPVDIDLRHPLRHTQISTIQSVIRNLCREAWQTVRNRKFLHIAADRDIAEEPETDITKSRDHAIQPNGRGATLLLHGFHQAQSLNEHRLWFRDDFLKSVRDLTGSDLDLRAIETQTSGGRVEAFLRIGNRYTPLSECGSGLKTILLTLLQAEAIKRLKNHGSHTTICIEEPENNLHPHQLRRLLDYLVGLSRNGTNVILTTHSPVPLDYLLDQRASVINVFRQGDHTRTSPVSSYPAHRDVIHEIGVRPSDLLQAKGIVWVEGPSDRVYVRKWIELLDKDLREGRDYQFAFLGGSMAASATFAAPDQETQEDLLRLLRLGCHAAAVMDSDRRAPDSELKNMVLRVKTEIDALTRSCCWITGCRTIENYLPLEVIRELLPKDSPQQAPGQYECFYSKDDPDSYYRRLAKRPLNKVRFARDAAELMSLENMKGQYDWTEQVNRLVKTIQLWS